MEKTCSGIGSSVYLAGWQHLGRREDKTLLTCGAHSPELDNLNTMWLDVRHVGFIMSLVFRGCSPARMCSVTRFSTLS